MCYEYRQFQWILFMYELIQLYEKGPNKKEQNSFIRLK